MVPKQILIANQLGNMRVRCETYRRLLSLADCTTGATTSGVVDAADALSFTGSGTEDVVVVPVSELGVASCAAGA